MAKQTYIAGYNKSIAAVGGVYQSNVQILSPNRSIKLKRLTLNWQIRDNTGLKIPIATQTTQFMEVLINDPGGAAIAQSMFTVTQVPNWNGTRLMFFEPGQYSFDWFVMKNSIEFIVTLTNNAAAGSMTHWLMLTVETEETPLIS